MLDSYIVLKSSWKWNCRGNIDHQQHRAKTTRSLSRLSILEFLFLWFIYSISNLIFKKIYFPPTCWSEKTGKQTPLDSAHHSVTIRRQ